MRFNDNVRLCSRVILVCDIMTILRDDWMMASDDIGHELYAVLILLLQPKHAQVQIAKNMLNQYVFI